jgi:DNA-binding response OmpR family regulator
MMTGDTVLVIDADLATEDKIVSTLESEGYIVFASSGSKINADMAKKFRPALIFLKPLAPSAAGFEVCRTIHTMEALRDVPIVILASLKGPIDPRYTAYYGIVDYLKLTFTPEELLEKTAIIIRDRQQEAEHLSEVQVNPVEEQKRADEQVSNAPDEPAYEKKAAELSPVVEERKPERPREVRPVVPDDDAIPEDRSEWGEKKYAAPHYRRRSSGRNSVKVVLLAITAVIILSSAGFALYKMYLQPQKPALKMFPPVELQKKQSVAEQKPDAAPQSAPLPPASVKVPVPVPLPSAVPFYAVQLGAFKTEATAEALAQKFKGKGYEAFVQRGIAKDSSVVYRVLIGRLGDRKEAATLAAAIGAKEKIKTTIYNSK